MVFHYLQGMVGLTYNGNPVNAEVLRQQLSTYGSVFQTTTDTEIIANLLARYSQDPMEQAIAKCMIDLKGGYALVIAAGDRLIGARDPMGIRPLCIGEPNGNYILASESVAFDTIGARLLRDVQPGEIVSIDKDGLHSIQHMPSPRRAFMHIRVYLLCPAGQHYRQYQCLSGPSGHGRQLARESNIEADIVISVPDSGTSAALGYAEQSGLPFHEGLIKNRYVGRTFIQPTQKMRENSVLIKLERGSRGG